MGTLYLDQKDLTVRLDGSGLALYQGMERCGTVPIKPLERVVCWGSSISIETRVFHRLVEEGVTLIFLSGKQGRFAGCLTGRLHQNAPIRLEQYRASLDEAFCLRISRQLIAKKLVGQSLWMESLEQEVRGDRVAIKEALRRLSEALDNCKTAGSLESLRGVEGSAAAAYFAGFALGFTPSLGFTGRQKRPPPDPVNACLSLTYTLLYREMVREALICGLDPVIGFYHQFEYGRESLAADLVEPFRPYVDRWVWALFREKRLSSPDFTTEKERSGCYLNKDGRATFFESSEQWMGIGIRSSLRRLCQSLARLMLGEIDEDALFDGIRGD